MTIWPAMQLKPLLCSRWVATCSAWNLRSAFDQLPGTTITGETPPSSLVIGLSSVGVPAALAVVPWSPGPQTTASWVASLPVMCTAVMPGWSASADPTSAPPVTISTRLRSIIGLKTARNTSSSGSVVGLSLRTTVRLSA